MWDRSAWNALRTAAPALALVVSCHLTDPNDRRHEAVDSFSHTVAAANLTLVQVGAVSGSIEMWGDPAATSVTIEGERRVTAPSRSEAERRLDDLEVRVTRDDGRLLIQTLEPTSARDVSFQVAYRVVAPAGLDLTVDAANGSLAVTDLAGDLVVRLANGDVELTRLAGTVDVRLTNGQLDAELEPSGVARIEIDVVNGAIDLGVPKSLSAWLTAQVVNGTIAVSQLTLFDVVQSRTRLEARLASGVGSVDLSLVNGDVHVRGR